MGGLEIAAHDFTASRPERLIGGPRKALAPGRANHRFAAGAGRIERRGGPVSSGSNSSPSGAGGSALCAALGATTAAELAGAGATEPAVFGGAGRFAVGFDAEPKSRNAPLIVATSAAPAASASIPRRRADIDFIPRSAPSGSSSSRAGAAGARMLGSGGGGRVPAGLGSEGGIGAGSMSARFKATSTVDHQVRGRAVAPPARRERVRSSRPKARRALPALRASLAFRRPSVPWRPPPGSRRGRCSIGRAGL